MLAGSIGKTFVAAAILQAVDDGVLDLDTKIERWLGVETWFGRPPNARTLTLRLLLSHRSGLPDHTDEEQFRKAIISQLTKRWTPQELIQWVLDKKPAFAAGTKYSYSQMNYIVYGLGVEVAPSEAGPVYMHDGWIPGYVTAMIYFPNYKIAAAIQINADPLKRFKWRRMLALDGSPEWRLRTFYQRRPRSDRG